MAFVCDTVARSSPIEAVALGIVVGIGYWLAARLSLLLLTPTDGVAVFWPAAGIASGVLIALGPKARWPVAAGVMAATVAANLQGDRNLATAIVFAFCNAGEALFAAWLIERRYGSGFNFDSVRHVLALLCGDRRCCCHLGRRCNGRVHPVPQPGRTGADHLARLVRRRCTWGPSPLRR